MMSSSEKQLGWVGVDKHASNIKKLRDYLLQHNGIHGLELCNPEEVERATRLFHLDGFVVVKDALSSEQLEFARHGCYREIQKMLQHDASRDGNRGSSIFLW